MVLRSLPRFSICLDSATLRKLDLAVAFGFLRKRPAPRLHGSFATSTLAENAHLTMSLLKQEISGTANSCLNSNFRGRFCLGHRYLLRFRPLRAAAGSSNGSHLSQQLAAGQVHVWWLHPNQVHPRR